MRIFVGNVSYGVSESELRDFFSEYEPIEDIHMPLDRETGRPRGFAFITLSSREFGEAAIENLDGAELDGRRLRVNEAEERGGGGGGGGYRGGGGGGHRGGGHRGGGDRDNRRERRDRDSGKRYRSL
ncbi:MAG: RNA-binding protein [Verrucomicrobiota bacterium]